MVKNKKAWTNEVKCMYCGTAPNNSTRNKDLKVCCCYMLHKKGDNFTQYHEDKEPTTFSVGEKDND